MGNSTNFIGMVVVRFQSDDTDIWSVNIKHLLSESRNGLKMPEIRGRESTIITSFKLPVENDNK